LVLWDGETTLNPDPEPVYDFFCANRSNPADFIRFDTQMPLCDSRNETAGLTTGCCTEANCNQVLIPSIVSRCYDGGEIVDAVNNVNLTIPTLSVECDSPDNQYCQVKIFKKKVFFSKTEIN
jgi:hypothetical protein